MDLGLPQWLSLPKQVFGDLEIGVLQRWMVMEEFLILVETLEILHGTFSMSTGALHRYESPKFVLAILVTLILFGEFQVVSSEIQAWEALYFTKKLTANKAQAVSS